MRVSLFTAACSLFASVGLATSASLAQSDAFAAQSYDHEHAFEYAQTYALGDEKAAAAKAKLQVKIAETKAKETAKKETEKAKVEASKT